MVQVVSACWSSTWRPACCPGRFWVRGSESVLLKYDWFLVCQRSDQGSACAPLLGEEQHHADFFIVVHGPTGASMNSLRRRPSRELTDLFWQKIGRLLACQIGWTVLVLLPPSPWQLAHTIATLRPNLEQVFCQLRVCLHFANRTSDHLCAGPGLTGRLQARKRGRRYCRRQKQGSALCHAYNHNLKVVIVGRCHVRQKWHRSNRRQKLYACIWNAGPEIPFHNREMLYVL